MVSAMLVDIAPDGKTFPAFNTSGSYVPKTTLSEGGAWMGGGLANYNYTKLNATDVSYKIISRGWMDLCNPGAGFDSNTASARVALDGKTYQNYTIYLQSTVYEVEAGHTLALVIYAHEPGMSPYYTHDENWNLLVNPDFQNYQITVKNRTVSAKIPVDQPTSAFGDVSADSYCADAVKWAVENGVTNGTTAAAFSPNAACTRGQIVTFLWRAAGSPAPKTTVNPFTDVAADAYYAKAVLWAVENGITNGTTAATFSPDAPCTRAQAVTFLFRGAIANGLEAVTLQELVSGFSDAASLPGYAVSAMNWALANGIVQGNGGALMPNNTCTRGQIVTFLYRASK